MRLNIFAITAVTLLAACASMPDEPLRATAQLQPTKGSKTFGEATFEEVDGKVHVVIFVQGLKPGQEHGLHIHEVGDCSSGDGMSTKGHFNPYGKPHAHAGHRGAPRRRPAFAQGRQGRPRQGRRQARRHHRRAGPASIVGRGLIVHADPDDYKTQPTGNAGARIACGVIKAE